MRLVKTALSVFICALIGYFRGQPTFYSMIAAIICLQNSREKTITSSINRVIATLIGGIFGVAVLYGAAAVGIRSIQPLYYLVVSVMIIPIIWTTLAMDNPGIAGLSCIVFICVTVSHGDDASPALFALQRVLDTVIGIAVTLVVDLTLPHRQKQEALPHQSEAAPPAQPEEKKED